MRRYLSLVFTIFTFYVSYSQNAKIEGKVMDADTSEPLENVLVSVVNSEKNVVTDSLGFFTIEALENESFKLEFQNYNYRFYSRKISLSNKQVISLTIKLNRKFNDLEEVTVVGRGKSLVGISSSASEGIVGASQIEQRPISRTGEVMETVPGLIISQHSGSGKANQFYLRGLNLDHGTDFSTSIEGMPLNLPTHAHGQGYLDMNFLIPEMIDQIGYRKGTYRVQDGNFSSAGAADITYGNLKNSFVKAEVGVYNYYRGLFANSDSIGNYNLVYGGEYLHSDGPWESPENTNKFSGAFKFNTGDTRKGHSISGIIYNNSWDATDQIPQRAIDQNILNRFGNVDETDGGSSQRYALIGNLWYKSLNGNETRITGYASYYSLNLFSNFTYFLENPERGDQFEQADERFYAGVKTSHKWNYNFLGITMQNDVGLQLRHDQIFEVGLYNTEGRERFNTVRSDKVGESTAGAFYENKIQWNEWFRSIVGLRGDYYYFDVESDIQVNSGNEHDFIASPKLQIILGPWYETEFYLNVGTGFHSNDARGTTIQQDPSTGEDITNVDPLVRSKGAEIGVRTTIIEGLQSSVAFWYLGLDSELVFVGDAGGTEASDASRHFGIEWSNYYQPLDYLTLDLDISLNHSRFTDVASNLDRIPNSISTTVKAGVNIYMLPEWYAELRMRYFGPQPLSENGLPKSDDTNILNFKTAYQWNDITISLDVLNILNQKDSDISYFYASQLREESQEVEDIHFHPVLSRTARLSLSYNF